MSFYKAHEPCRFRICFRTYVEMAKLSNIAGVSYKYANYYISASGQSIIKSSPFPGSRTMPFRKDGQIVGISFSRGNIIILFLSSEPPAGSLGCLVGIFDTDLNIIKVQPCDSMDGFTGQWFAVATPKGILAISPNDKTSRLISMNVHGLVVTDHGECKFSPVMEFGEGDTGIISMIDGNDVCYTSAKYVRFIRPHSEMKEDAECNTAVMSFDLL